MTLATLEEARIFPIEQVSDLEAIKDFLIDEASRKRLVGTGDNHVANGECASANLRLSSSSASHKFTEE